MRRYAPLAAGLVAGLLAAAWARAPIDGGVPKGSYCDVLKPYVGQRCSFHSSQGQHYLHFPEDKAMNWESTQLVEVGDDYVKVGWNEQERYIPIGNVELLVAKRR